MKNFLISQELIKRFSTHKRKHKREQRKRPRQKMLGPHSLHVAYMCGQVDVVDGTRVHIHCVEA